MSSWVQPGEKLCLVEVSCPHLRLSGHGGSTHQRTRTTASPFTATHSPQHTVRQGPWGTAWCTPINFQSYHNGSHRIARAARYCEPLSPTRIYPSALLRLLDLIILDCSCRSGRSCCLYRCAWLGCSAGVTGRESCVPCAVPPSEPCTGVQQAIAAVVTGGMSASGGADTHFVSTGAGSSWMMRGARILRETLAKSTPRLTSTALFDLAKLPKTFVDMLSTLSGMKPSWRRRSTRGCSKLRRSASSACLFTASASFALRFTWRVSRRSSASISLRALSAACLSSLASKSIPETGEIGYITPHTLQKRLTASLPVCFR